MIYQFMTKKKEGRYVPDWNLLKERATQSELICINDMQEQQEKLKELGIEGFLFPLIYLAEHSCGHAEMFMSPVKEKWDITKIFSSISKTAGGCKCTKCSLLEMRENRA